VAVHTVTQGGSRPRRGAVPRRGARAALVVGVVLALAACNDGGSDVTDPEASVRVDLLSTTESLQGHEWPERQDGTRSEAATVERPVDVEVRLGEGRIFGSPSQLTFIHQRQDEIVSVEVQPPAELVSLTEVIDDVEDLLDRNDARTSELAERLDEWRALEETEPGWPSSGDRLATRVELEPGVELAVRLRQRGDEGWFYTVSLFRPVETWPAADR
jgi:hypothetical protein